MFDFENFSKLKKISCSIVLLFNARVVQPNVPTTGSNPMVIRQGCQTKPATARLGIFLKKIYPTLEILSNF